MGTRFSWAASILLVLLAVPACAQEADTAKQFLASIYRHYDHHGKGIDLVGPGARAYFDAPLIALLQADAEAVGPGQAGVLDGDPICSCQDWDGIYDLKIALQVGRVGRAQAAVSFALFAPTAGGDRDFRSLEMTLVRKGNGWRIHNIVDKSDAKAPFDLRAELQKEIGSSKPESVRRSKP